eukprot:10577529-Karenia_brevis.AAC.1
MGRNPASALSVTKNLLSFRIDGPKPGFENRKTCKILETLPPRVCGWSAEQVTSHPGLSGIYNTERDENSDTGV